MNDHEQLSVIGRFKHNWEPQTTNNHFLKDGNGEFQLVGGFNPFETYQSRWESSPNKDEHKKYLKPPPSQPFIKIIK